MLYYSVGIVCKTLIYRTQMRRLCICFVNNARHCSLVTFTFLYIYDKLCYGDETLILNFHYKYVMNVIFFFMIF